MGHFQGRQLCKMCALPLEKIGHFQGDKSVKLFVLSLEMVQQQG